MFASHAFPTNCIAVHFAVICLFRFEMNEFHYLSIGTLLWNNFTNLVIFLWKKKSRSKLNTVAWRCCIWNNNCSFSRCIHFYLAPPFFHFHPQAFQFPCSNRFGSRRKSFNESKHFRWANSEMSFLQLKSPIRFCLKFYDLDVRVQFFCCISSHFVIDFESWI